jgi:hypothetical protein
MIPHAFLSRVPLCVWKSCPRRSITYNRSPEVGFYEDFFADVEHLIPITASLAALAYTEACQAGLSGLDALHIAAAKLGEAEEFITTEKPTHTLFRVTGMVIKTIMPSSNAETV